MIDFTFKAYNNLLIALTESGYIFQPFHSFFNTAASKVVILRHDIDARKQNALVFAQIEQNLGICSTYFFRIVPQSFSKKLILKIAESGHEIGYHYEDLALAKGNVDKAYGLFCRNLEQFRKLYPVKTICMHGSPLSKWDNRKIWEKYDYRKLGIIGEPYFDVDFTRVLYLTDTGRRWNGNKVSVRDKIASGLLSVQYNFHSTFDIIRAVEKGKLPDKIMLTTHPQRWNSQSLPWIKEYIFQNCKNVIKRYFYVSRKNYYADPK